MNLTKTGVILSTLLLNSCYHYAEATEVSEEEACDWRVRDRSPVSVSCVSGNHRCVVCFESKQYLIQCKTFNSSECYK